MEDFYQLVGANEAIRGRLLSMFGPKAVIQTRDPHPSFHALFGRDSQFSSKNVKSKLQDVLSNMENDKPSIKLALRTIIEHESFNNEMIGFDLTLNHPLDYHRWNRSAHAEARKDLPIFRRIRTKPQIASITWREIPSNEKDREISHIQEFPVTLAQYQKFVDDGGYQCRRYWQEEHWDWVTTSGKMSPRSWSKIGTWATTWFLRRVPISAVPDYPVCHISLAEAMAFAAYQEERLTGTIRGKISLPSEEQWASAAAGGSSTSLVEDDGILEHRDLSTVDSRNSYLGNAWEWTCSKSIEKDEFILRGGSVLTCRRLLAESSLSRPATCDRILNTFRLVCTDEIAHL